ncbi:MAG TPA: aldose 1-epimerase [Acidimicrobiales bacterium]|nr:aldose 1-epimerase [Acidimicrobiales bacterium]
MEVVALELDHSSGRRLRAEIAPEFGSNLFRLRFGELDLLRCDLDLLRSRRWTGTPILWPVPNRVSGKRYRFGTKVVDLSRVERPEGNWPLIHGFVDDQPWQHETSRGDAATARARTWIEIAPCSTPFEYFPFPSRLTLEFTLHSGGLRVDYTVENLGGEALPFAFALHPYFALLDGGATQLAVPADAVMEADDDLLPTGRLVPVADAGCDLREPTSPASLALDHVFTDLHPGEHSRLIHPRSGVEIELVASGDFTHVVVYTLKAASDGFVCVENQTGSTDAINLHTRAVETEDPALERAAHLLVVPPGGSHTGYVEYRVRALEG